ncbi:MAG: hydrogenase iron-sulfur subunit [Actinobacteria bacterium]|nr:hydrogenase iron-sulfur subunit [Actinomycetota bacterium]
MSDIQKDIQNNDSNIKIIAFLCNWCSYGGADTAGTSRLKQPSEVRIIRIPCTGRVNPLFPMKAFIDGADGVLISGCHPNDCHYIEGNFYARRRLEVLKYFIDFMGIEKERFDYQWVSASEGQRWQQLIIDFVERIKKLGPIGKCET